MIGYTGPQTITLKNYFTLAKNTTKSHYLNC